VGMWDLPQGATAGAWLVGLQPGRSHAVLDQLGTTEAVSSTSLPNAYVLNLPTEADVMMLGQQIAALDGVAYYVPLGAQHYSARAIPTDPLFPQQWHLQNTGQTGGTPGADANVVTAWDPLIAGGPMILGSGVVIGIVDDGLQYTHPDLAPNYRADLSYD